MGNKEGQYIIDKESQYIIDNKESQLDSSNKSHYYPLYKEVFSQSETS